ATIQLQLRADASERNRSDSRHEDGRDGLRIEVRRTLIEDAQSAEPHIPAGVGKAGKHGHRRLLRVRLVRRVARSQGERGKSALRSQPPLDESRRTNRPRHKRFFHPECGMSKFSPPSSSTPRPTIRSPPWRNMWSGGLCLAKSLE